MHVVLRQLVGLRCGARGVCLLPLCTCWHFARACFLHALENHLLENFIMHMCCALCTHDIVLILFDS
jgi:hypothetical protein